MDPYYSENMLCNLAVVWRRSAAEKLDAEPISPEILDLLTRFNKQKQIPLPSASNHSIKFTARPLATLLLLSAANAVESPTKINQYHETRREIQQVEQQKREDVAWSLQKNQQSEPHTATDNTDENTTCLAYSNIKVQGATLIDITPHQTKLAECISEFTLNQFIRDVVADYINAGYLNPQFAFDIKQDTFFIQVQERKIREISGGSRTVNIDMLFPNHQQRPVNMQYLDQGIEQANKLVGNQVSMDVYPHDNGDVSIELQNEQSKPWFASVTLDNRGTKQQRQVVRTLLGIDSPLGLSDQLWISAFSNIKQMSDRYSRGMNMMYNVPYGAWTFSAYTGLSGNKNVTTFDSGSRLIYQTQTVMGGIKGERVISRGQAHIGYGYMGLDYLRTSARYGGSKIAMQSPRLASLQLGMAHSTILPHGIWLNDFHIEQGVSLFGTKQLENSPFHSTYTAFHFQSDLLDQRWLGDWLLRRQHRLGIQFSADDLYSAKQFSVSDRSYVRGFNKWSLEGNKGIALQNTLFLRKYIKDKIYTEPYIGFDLGTVKDSTQRYKGMGIAVGLNVAKESQWQLSLEIARGFIRAKQGVRAKENQVNASLRFTF